MEERKLRDFETFEEFPDGFIEIKSNTNLMYIQKESETFIAREFIKKAIGYGLNVEYTVNYEDVIDGKIILTLDITKDKEETIINENTQKHHIIPLDKILNIKGHSVYYFGLEDVKNLINFKEEKPTKIRKYYF